MIQRIPSSAIKVIFLLTGLFCLWPTFEVFPCTLFGAVGNSVEGGGVLIGKTRDRQENSEQTFIEVVPKGGYRYRGISVKSVKRVTSGINEKGLVVVSAAASNVEKEDKVTTVGKILSSVKNRVSGLHYSLNIFFRFSTFFNNFKSSLNRASNLRVF